MYLITSVLLAGAFTSLVAFPGAAALTASAAPPFRVMRIGVGGLELQTLNPNSMTLVMEYVVTFNVYSTLLTRDGNYAVRGDLAYQWSVAPDNITWTFHLVRDAYFTNPYAPHDHSHPVTADDVVFSYQVQQNATASIWSTYTTQIQNVIKVDPYTVQIITNGPYAAIYSALTSVPILPMYLWYPIAYPSGLPASPDNITTATPAVHPVGSGAMYMSDPANTSLSSGPIVFERNPNYYGLEYYCQASRPNEVRYLLYPATNLASMISDFTSGQSKLDTLLSVDAPSFKKTLPPNGVNGMFKTAVDSGFVGEFSINVMTPAIRAAYGAYAAGSNNPLLLNDTVRLAIAMSIDKPALIQAGLLGLGTVADTLVPDTNPWHYAIPANEAYKFDPVAARALLNAAGWNLDSAGHAATSTTTPLYRSGPTGAKDPLLFRMYAPNTHPEFEPMMANISTWLFEAGIQTTGSPTYAYTPGVADQRNYMQSGTFMGTAWQSSDYDLWLWDWVFSTISDPSVDVLSVETTASIPNLVSDNYYSNQTYDRLYNESLTLVDPVARRHITDQLQKMIYDYHSYILPFYEWNLYASTNRSDLASGWENMGNWTTSPGLAPDSDLPNLWFQVYPHDSPPPAISAFPSIGYVNGTPAFLNVVAGDPKNSALTYTWDFGDGSNATTTTSVVSHTWARAGNYNVSVRVANSEWVACASSTATIVSASAGQNLPPQGLLSYQLPAYENAEFHAWENKAIAFNFTAMDPNGDNVYVTWNFGDGTASPSDRVMGTSGSGATVTEVHTYAAQGNYNLMLTFTDNQTGAGTHTVTRTYVIPVWAVASSSGPPSAGAINPWISYGVPAAIGAIIVVAVAAVVLSRRKTLRKESMEEQQEVKPGSPPPPPP